MDHHRTKDAMSGSRHVRKMTAGEVLRSTRSCQEHELVELWMREGKTLAVWQDTNPTSKTQGSCKVATYRQEPVDELQIAREATLFRLIGVWNGQQ